MRRLPPSWSVYLVRCGDGTLYCGIARDVNARIAAHIAGKGARYTRGRGPLVLLAEHRCRDQGTALRIERAIKKLPRDEKVAAAADGRRWAAIARAVRIRGKPGR
ncbi:MAG TPA: GIY-YIG nuclease family protein [Polyangia bacterium]|nr:GIY-YIG nuclease family protein [Polyangia bacterium]